MSVEVRKTLLAYEAYLDGVRVGSLSFSRTGSTITALHTEVDPAAEGEGVGSALAKALLAEVASTGGTVVPECAFVAAYLKRHPEYADLVAPPS